MRLASPAIVYCRGCWANLADTTTTCTRCGGDPQRPAAATPALQDRGPARPDGPRPAGAGAGVLERTSRRVHPIAWLVLGLALLVATAVVPGLRSGSGPAAAPGTGATVPPAVDREAGPDPAPAADAPVDADVALPLLAIQVGQPALTPGEAAADLGPAAALYAAAHAAHLAGDHEGAAARLREARARLPGHPELTRALATTLVSLGAARLSRGDPAGAASALSEAVAVDPERAEAWKALGYAQLHLHDRRAAASLGTAVRLAPDDGETRLLLGIALYHAGDTAAAAAQLRAGRAAAAGDPRVAALLARVEREASAERGFDRAESEHFAVSFEGGGTSAQAGHLVSLLLEEAYYRVGAGLDYYPPDTVHAVLYAAQQFRDVTRSPGWAGALYDGKIRLPVGGLTEKSDLLARVVRHEYTHAVVHRLARGRAPTWLNEGLAVLQEGESHDALLERLRAHVRAGGAVTSLRQLEGSFLGMSGAQAQAAYLYSLAATDYLVRRYGLGATRRILEQLGEGRSLDEALRETLFVSYDDFDRAWAASLR